eukprot:358715-Chlamydomonas_euryale.AAC.1
MFPSRRFQHKQHRRALARPCTSAHAVHMPKCAPAQPRASACQLDGYGNTCVCHLCPFACITPMCPHLRRDQVLGQLQPHLLALHRRIGGVKHRKSKATEYLGVGHQRM